MNTFGVFLFGRPEPAPWKSQWRKDFEADYARRSAEEAAARAADPEPRRMGVARCGGGRTGGGARVSAHRCAAGCGAGVRYAGDRCHRCNRNGRARGLRSHKCCTEGCSVQLQGNGKYCAACVAVRPKPLNRGGLVTLCACGREIRRKERLHCCTCLDRPKQAGIARGCAECGKLLNADNRSGLCKKHAHAKFMREQWALHGPLPTCRWEGGGMRCAQSLYRTNRTGLCRYHAPGGGLKPEERLRGPKLEPIAASGKVAA